MRFAAELDRGSGLRKEHYRFQYPEPQSKDDEAEWRETPTSGAGPLFTITSSELVVRQWLRWRDFSKQRATRLPARTRTYTRQCRPGYSRWGLLIARGIARRTLSRSRTSSSSGTRSRAEIQSLRRC